MGPVTRSTWIAAGVAALLGIGVAWLAWRTLGSERAPAGAPLDAPAQFMGSSTCAACHSQQYADWESSHHSLAMQEAGEGTVLGDFGGATFDYAGITSTFFRRDGEFMVRTDGPGGELEDYQVAYTFGVDPLQQYLVRMPDGRLQALSIAWDVRPHEQGGQRWFHLYPDERIDATDALHWTGVHQNWNSMCADCHSTNLRKNYDPDADRFRTTWSEISVGCEACHGPGSRHLDWARTRTAGEGDRPERGRMGLLADLSERHGVRWIPDAASGTSARSEPRETRNEIQVCAQCHARRAQVAEGYVAGAPLLDHYLPALLTPDLYHADGQQLDEVYTYGSFLQSRMFHAGVTCSDCHDPHGGELRASGDALCAQCHSPARYQTTAHHFHQPTGEGARCVACHMPATTYMQIDPRRDHSIRVPRPQLTVELGTPNACNACHQDRGAAWAAEQAREWYGDDPVGFQRFAADFHADASGAPGAAPALARIAGDTAHPAIVRASALGRLAGRQGTSAPHSAIASLRDEDPLVRYAALLALEPLPPQEWAGNAARLLEDSTRVVRGQATWALAPFSTALSGSAAVDFDRSAEEFVASQRYQADRPESRTTLGSFFSRLGRMAEAEEEYRAALRLSRRYFPAYINLADLYRHQGREEDAGRILSAGIDAVPGNAELHFALGLSRARAGRIPEAVAELERAAALAPQNRRFAYTYAIALHSSGRVREAIDHLRRSLSKYPDDRDILFALATFHRDAGEREAALRYAELLSRAHPGDAEAQALRESLRASSPR